MVLGSVQVPLRTGARSSSPNDHPTTGGYPVIGAVTELGLAAAVQASAGTPVRFTPGDGPRPARRGHPARARRTV
ncbi:hypothetical protein [Streptomyces sp. NPDC094021]|uniref:hypothetical protein n=1 Tax=Streptomyces sp. NPDC094021 TaxID=3366054 RepID=UPI0038144813